MRSALLCVGWFVMSWLLFCVSAVHPCGFVALPFSPPTLASRPSQTLARSMLRSNNAAVFFGLLQIIELGLSHNRSVVLVKVGGSSITNKAVRETLNAGALQWFAQTVKRAQILDQAFVIVHGAGSFGHHTAKEYGLKGQSGVPPPDYAPVNEATQRTLMKGLSHTRVSVQKLNQAVVSTFVDHGVSAIGVSPCFGIPGMQAHGGDTAVRQHLLETVRTSVAAGLVPIIHGDACLYGEHGAGILSGDTVMEIVGQAPWVSHAVFLTDVDGVFSADPKTDDSAVLLRTLKVDTTTREIVSTGALWDATGSTHEHDVTGGLKTKLASAASIATAGKNVTIVRCGSASAEKAIVGGGGGSSIDLATVLMPSTLSSTQDSVVVSIRAFARAMKSRYRAMLFAKQQ